MILAMVLLVHKTQAAKLMQRKAGGHRLTLKVSELGY